MGRDIYARETRFGRYFEEFEPGDTYHHWPGKTITEADDHLFCMLTMNHHPLHTDAHYAEHRDAVQGGNVVISNLVYSLVLGMSVPDVSGKAIANLEIESLRHARPTFHGDTIYAAARRCSTQARVDRSKPDRGIVTVEGGSAGTSDEGPLCGVPAAACSCPRRPAGGGVAHARLDLEVQRASRRRCSSATTRRWPRSAPATCGCTSACAPTTASSSLAPAPSKEALRGLRPRRRIPRAARTTRPARAVAARRLRRAPRVRERNCAALRGCATAAHVLTNPVEGHP